MQLYDISMSVTPHMSVYKNKEDKRPVIGVKQDFFTSHTYESYIRMDMHTGTHLDAPLHILENGLTVETIGLNRLITRCKVFDMSRVTEKITAGDLVSRGINGGDFLLLKTRNSFVELFDPQFVYLDKGGAEYLQEKGIQGVGIDALGIERAQPEHETHKILLTAGIVILEGLRLKDVPEGEYFLIALPLKVVEVEAAPVRAILIDILDLDSLLEIKAGIRN
ncbi:MAG: cyclase family protein [Desulfitobacteriaceae bacterium]